MNQSASKQYLILSGLLLWALIAQCTVSGFAVRSVLNGEKGARLPFVLREYTTNIQFLMQPYHGKGLREGDKIVALDGKKIDGYLQLAQMQNGLHAGSKLQVTVERGNPPVRSDIPLTIEMDRSAALSWSYVIGIFVLLPLAGLLVGFYIAFARPLDPVAWITLAMLASFGQIAGQSTWWGIWAPWREIAIVYRATLSTTWPLWMVLFAFYFPSPFPFIKRNRWIVWLCAAWPMALAALDLYGNLMQGRHVRELVWLAELDKRIAGPTTTVFFIYVFAFFFFLSWKRRLLTTNDERRRLQVMVAGCGISLTPMIPIVMGQFGLVRMLPPWIAVVSLSMLVFFPLTIAYVIVVQRAMDVRMVLRSGVQYAVASTGIKVIQALLVTAVVVITIHFEQESDHRLEGIGILALGMAMVLLLGRLAHGVGQWIDKRFFREAYNAERILSELGGSVASIRDVPRLLETVTNRIADSLHVPRIAVLLEQAGGFQPAYALGFHNGTPAIRFAQQTATVRTLKRSNAPSKIYFDDPQSWVHGASEPEQTALQKLGTQILLPLSLNSNLLGIISLGSKRSELPYTKADLQLLGAVAAQTGLALENARLTETIRVEIAQRERLDRELEIARDVQMRLFPQKLPVVHGLDFAGYCRPAQGVGGDYYDFIRLSNGALGIAVGDVSGKGIAAALMMANLQASLRAQTIKPCDTLAEMIHHMNQLVFQASANNRYATFFYAQYDPTSRKLTYVNAGHNPPMLRRKKDSGCEFIRLEEGGTVIGLLENAIYKEGEVEMESGDILLAFTDGISEAMDNSNQEFDEERLMEVMRVCPDRSAADISSYVLEHVDRFTAGAKQHDDMTIVVMRFQ